MAIGILLGNLVPSTGPALRKGEFVGVSLPIGMLEIPSEIQFVYTNTTILRSGWPACHDVPHSVQSEIRVSAPPSTASRTLDTNWDFIRSELDRCSSFYGRPRMGISP